jgi:hypothetical protein
MRASFIRKIVLVVVLRFILFKNKVKNVLSENIVRNVALLPVIKNVRKNIITSLLILILGFEVIFIPLLKPMQGNVLHNFIADEVSVKESISSLSASLFPNGFRKKTSSVKGVSTNQSHTASNLSNQSSNTTKKSSSFSSRSSTKEDNESDSILQNVKDTVEGRDSDRELISQLLADAISYYYALHGKLPNIYSDKSKKELSLSNPTSNTLYFYNSDENKVNALSLTLGTDDSSYIFHRVLTCIDNNSKQKNINFIYDSSLLTLCFERGEVRSFWIVN